MISLPVHSALDYVAAAFLLACPFIFGFSDIAPARNVFLAVGLGVAAYSLLSRLPYSASKLISARAHLTLDVLAGVVLIVSPWLFGYTVLIGTGVYALHWILGLAGIAIVSLTHQPPRPGTSMRERPQLRRVA